MSLKNSIDTIGNQIRDMPNKLYVVSVNATYPYVYREHKNLDLSQLIYPVLLYLFCYDFSQR